MSKAFSKTTAMRQSGFEPKVAELDLPYNELPGIKVGRDDELSQLVGRLLTYIDATYNDLEQRRAHKRLVKDTIYTWYYDVYDSQKSERSLRGYPREFAE